MTNIRTNDCLNASRREWEDEFTAYRNGTIKTTPNLLRVLMRTFGLGYLRSGIIFNILEALLFLYMPIFIHSCRMTMDPSSCNYYSLF